MASQEFPIVFVGHFEIGETYRPLDGGIVATGCRDKGALSILVGDIGLREKIWTYLHDGIDGLIRGYEKRWNCSKGRACVHLQVPDLTKSRTVIDIEHYERALSILHNDSPAVLDYIRHVGFDVLKTNNQILYGDFAYVCRERILPEIVSSRLRDYGLSEMDRNQSAEAKSIKRNAVNIFSEQNMLNIAHRRLRIKYSRRNQSWRGLDGLFAEDLDNSNIAYLGPEQMTSINGTPLCRAIMLALYQEIGRMGAREVIEHYDERVAFSLSSAQSLVHIIARRFPNNDDWNLSFKTTIYRQTSDDSVVSQSLPNNWADLALIGSRYGL